MKNELFFRRKKIMVKGLIAIAAGLAVCAGLEQGLVKGLLLVKL